MSDLEWAILMALSFIVTFAAFFPLGYWLMGVLDRKYDWVSRILERNR